MASDMLIMMAIDGATSVANQVSKNDSERHNIARGWALRFLSARVGHIQQTDVDRIDREIEAKFR